MKENIIKSLIESRSIEAMKKKITLKLITIAQNLGSPIIGQYDGISSLPYMWEPEIQDEPDIAEISEETDETVLGYVYDSLKHGINFEIVLRSFGEKIESICAKLDGNIVYFEDEGGLLKGYAPHDRWERHMEDLFLHASKKEKRMIETEKEKEKNKNKTGARAFLEKLRLIWGYE